MGDYLTELSPDQASRHQNSIARAHEAVRELAQLRESLEEQKKEQDAKLERERIAFEEEQQRIMDSKIAEAEAELEKEAEKERKKNEKALLALNARKEAILKEKKAKVKDDVKKLLKEGGTKDDQEKLLKDHSQDLAKLV